MTASRRQFLRNLVPVGRAPATALTPAPDQPRQTSVDPTPAPGADTSSLGLPELRESLLDAAGLDALLRDIAACTQVIEVIPRHASQRLVGDRSITLQEGRSLLLHRHARAVQIRYRYDDAQWWDTVICQGHRFRIVRIRHDFDQPEH